MEKSDQIMRIREALAALRPSSLTVVDESHKHEGHGGWRAGAVTHIHIEIASAALDGKSRVAQHRAVMTLLAPFMAENLHAVRLTIIGCK